MNFSLHCGGHGRRASAVERSAKNLRLDAASAKDAEIIYEIKRQAYAGYAVQAYGVWDEAFHRQNTQKNLPGTRLIVVDNAIVGWVAVERREDAHELIELHILPGYQRKGHGQAVVRLVIAEANACGLPVVLSVLKINPARIFYERLGFAATGESATHLIMKRPNQPRQPSRPCGPRA